MIRLRGGERFLDMAARVRAAERALPHEFRGGLGRQATGLVADARRSAREILPRRGGYNEVVARSHFDVRLTRTTRGQRLVITATGPDYRLDKQGRLRHPVYARGPRTGWTWAPQTQRVPAGWFSTPMREGSHRLLAEIVAVMSRTTRRL